MSNLIVTKISNSAPGRERFLNILAQGEAFHDWTCSF